jgi:ABC-type sulfate transport system permease component
VQSRARSIKETGTNLVIGFAINYSANIVILPLFWREEAIFSSAFVVGLAFTVVSAARQYIIRRWFNKGDHRDKG